MKELKIYEFQAKQIEDTFRLVARVLESKSKTTSVDIKREISILKFMKKTDVLNYHHSTSDSMMTNIDTNIDTVSMLNLN